MEAAARNSTEQKFTGRPRGVPQPKSAYRVLEEESMGRTISVAQRMTKKSNAEENRNAFIGVSSVCRARDARIRVAEEFAAAVAWGVRKIPPR